ncbi:unnamed protein product, partial [Meganyctiphanes norvegica]
MPIVRNAVSKNWSLHDQLEKNSGGRGGGGGLHKAYAILFYLFTQLSTINLKLPRLQTGPLCTLHPWDVCRILGRGGGESGGGGGLSLPKPSSPPSLDTPLHRQRDRLSSQHQQYIQSRQCQDVASIIIIGDNCKTRKGEVDLVTAHERIPLDCILNDSVCNSSISGPYSKLALRRTILHGMRLKHLNLGEDDVSIVTTWMAFRTPNDSIPQPIGARIVVSQQRGLLQEQLKPTKKRQKSVARPKKLNHAQKICLLFILYLATYPSKKYDGPKGVLLTSVIFDQLSFLIIKKWDIALRSVEARGTLTGSNAGVTAIDFDGEESLILGASNDFASRVWSVVDYRLRHTLTGHSGKVMAARFLAECSKVVTGSHDRTLKIWDLKCRACIRTIFAGSSCNDLVPSDNDATTVISGHFDKKVRFWDTRTESAANEVPLQGKITSLCLSRDGFNLLACVRDDSLKILDLRKNQVVNTFSAEGFHVGADYTRAVFSPDGSYVACGSNDGGVYIWNVKSGKLEKSLRDHSLCVIACTWQPNGKSLVSCDRARKVIAWSDF